MARSNNVARKEPTARSALEQERRLKLVSMPDRSVVVDEEALEIAFGGGWEYFDSDDIDALRASGACWLPSNS